MLPDNVKNYLSEKFLMIPNGDFSEKQLGDGRSGAEVYRINIQSQRPQMTGHYIVKICEITGDRNVPESDKAIRLYNYATKFREHLVKVEAQENIDGKNVIVYTQANNSVMNSNAFSKLDANLMAEYTRRVSYDLLEYMNDINDINVTNQTSTEVNVFFDKLLNKQLGVKGRFAERIENLLVRPEAESVVINGVVYPNPFFFIKNLDRIQSHLDNIVFLKGACHGDLHSDNLIASDSSYALIDYDSTTLDSYLLFDHAYFEFSIFYDNSKDNDLKRWKAMLKHLIEPSIFVDTESCEYYMEYKVRNAVCGGITEWVNQQKLKRQKDTIEIQFMMARMAAAINFFCKKTCNNIGKQQKVLLYIAYCLKLVMKKIGCTYDENDISTLQDLHDSNNAETLWENFVKYRDYISILVTDDCYTAEESDELKAICGMDWAMVIDIGSEQKEWIIYELFLRCFKTREVKKVNVIADEKAETFRRILNIFSLRKSAEMSYAGLWRSYGKKLMPNVVKLLSENTLVPLLFVFDCKKDSIQFRNQLINALCDTNLPVATRFVSLRVGFSEDLEQEIVELEENRKWHFIKYIGADLRHVGQTCKLYLNESQYVEHSANLPSLNGYYTFTEKDLMSFASSIDLVYSGREYYMETGAGSLRIFDEKDSFGENFYKGNEATWDDIANRRDLSLMEKRVYTGIIENVSKWIEESSQRVKILELRHGAGAGGTTLAKRILWDMKETTPCVYLKKYSTKTAEMLLEIYQKTGKKVFLAVESGSTVITDEELNLLKQDVNSENGKLLILLIKRTNKNNSTDHNDTVLYTLPDNMPLPIANNFLSTFSKYVGKKRNSEERKKWLRDITQNRHYSDQRSPFFYGFYTYQEEYRLMDTLERTIEECTAEEKILLNCLAINTVFSQNIGVAFREVPVLLNQQIEEDLFSIHLIREMISPSINKLTVVRDNGFRLCHEIIAKKILFLLHHHGNQHNASVEEELESVIFQAINQYIEVMSNIYDSENEYVNGILRELLIDRAYIDSEERKTNFSQLVETIPRWSERRLLFEKLIAKFPDNPHYYSHLARLLAIGDMRNGIDPQYELAVQMSQKAIDIAADEKNTHETTLGCIYGWWINNDMQQEIMNKKRGRLAIGYTELIENISLRYDLAKSAFENARQYLGEGKYESYSFFPQIKMECTIIKNLLDYDLDRSPTQLLKIARRKGHEDEATFREWYEEHFSIIMELYTQWHRYSKEDKKLQKDARKRIMDIKEDFDDTIGERFDELLKSDLPSDRIYSRSLIHRFYAFNGFDWNNKGIKQENLNVAEKCARKNLMEGDEEHRAHDLETWFELYRRVSYFKADDAQTYIADYAEDGYRKEYLLFLMTFIMRKNGITSASAESVIKRIIETKRKAEQQALNTLRELDVYKGNSQGIVGCPIVSISDASRDEKGELKNLETFTGKVIEVGQTYGKILLDKLNLDVTFIPNPTSVSKDDPSKRFTREDEGKLVKLNIMFAYSGLRGWNVTKIN